MPPHIRAIIATIAMTISVEPSITPVRLPCCEYARLARQRRLATELTAPSSGVYATASPEADSRSRRPLRSETARPTRLVSFLVSNQALQGPIQPYFSRGGRHELAGFAAKAGIHAAKPPRLPRERSLVRTQPRPIREGPANPCLIRGPGMRVLGRVREAHEPPNECFVDPMTLHHLRVDVVREPCVSVAPDVRGEPLGLANRERKPEESWSSSCASL
jgi:hypothetical protein